MILTNMMLTVTIAVPLSGVSLPEAPDRLTLSSPLDYQVFQRHTPSEGALLIRGKTACVAEKWQVRLTGEPGDGPSDEPWHDLAPPAKDGALNFTLKAPAGGWYGLDVRGLSGSRIVAEAHVAHVGVGEVFIIAGQSNAGNYGSEKQVTQTGHVASFNGVQWALANDPQQGAGGDGGSFNAQGLQRHGHLWAEKVGAWLEDQIAHAPWMLLTRGGAERKQASAWVSETQSGGNPPHSKVASRRRSGC